MRFLPFLWAYSTATLLWLASYMPAQDIKIYQEIGPEKIESLLGELKIEFKKSPGKKEGIFFYDFERQNFKVRLHNYNGKDLWIDALFNEKLTLEDVNRWNQRARFSRAVLLKDKDSQTVSLESQLDCLGGVSDPVVKSFVSRFDREIAEFVKFLSK